VRNVHEVAAYGLWSEQTQPYIRCFDKVHETRTVRDVKFGWTFLE
jgi:hypothetical protein